MPHRDRAITITFFDSLYQPQKKDGFHEKNTMNIGIYPNHVMSEWEKEINSRFRTLTRCIKFKNIYTGIDRNVEFGFDRSEFV